MKQCFNLFKVYPSHSQITKKVGRLRDYSGKITNQKISRLKKFLILTLGFTSGSLIGSSLIGLAFSVALVPISLAILVCGSIGLLVGQTTLKVMRVANSVLSSQKVKDDSKL